MRITEIRSTRINHLLQIINGTTYLEIGVHKGKTFRHVHAATKVAIDPKFMFNISDYQKQEGYYFYEIPSDEYFAIHAKNHTHFEFIYLDGLHIFEQTLRDLINVQMYLSKKSIILIDDTIPTNIAAAEPDLDKFHKLRKSLGIEDKSWMGDIYKVILFVHDFFPNWSYYTFPEHGQTVLIQQPSLRVPRFKGLNEISNLSYSDFVLLRQEGLFNEKNSDIDIYNEIKKKISPTT